MQERLLGKIKMIETIQKPTFKEVIAFTTMQLDKGLVFNAKSVSGMGFNGLRNADYGIGFRMSTMPELVQLLYASLENRNYETAKRVINISEDLRLIGNTGILYTKKGMYVQDNPYLKKETISMNQKTLMGKLGEHEERGVVFSDDRSIRFTPYNYKTDYQSPVELSKNIGIIALTGGEENAEKIAMASKNYGTFPCFWTDSSSSQIRIASLSKSICGGLLVGAGNCDDHIIRYSFGIKN